MMVTNPMEINLSLDIEKNKKTAIKTKFKSFSCIVAAFHCLF